jgi:nucleoside-diphosphate-sugar epimerase
MRPVPYTAPVSPIQAPEPAQHTMLVAGAGGVVGHCAVEHFSRQPDWRVMALSRRRPAELAPGVTHLSLDLTDEARCRQAAPALAGVTHVLFAALFEKPDLVAGWRDPQQMAVNLTMLRNLLDALDEACPGLRHVTLLQGTKAYGGHWEPAPVPCKEHWPRHPHPNFYWLQEDLVRERQSTRGWTFSILRPQIVLGHAVGSPMNIVAAVGAYACVLRELGQPLFWPGGGRCVNGASDARLIAQAAEFTATHEVAANQTYNVVNGDVLLWQDLWGRVAAHFGLPVGGERPMCLSEQMSQHEGLWGQIAQRHGLACSSLAQLTGSSWQFADRAFAYGIDDPPDSVLSGIKLREHGFAGCYDTESSLVYWLTQMQKARLLPP